MSGRDYLSAIAVAVIWGLNFVVMKLGLQNLSPMMMGALRFALAFLPLMFFVRVPRVPARFVIGYGLTQGVGQFGFLFFALAHGMTAGMASVVMQSQAFFTMLLAVPLLGERVRPHQLLGILVAAFGLMLILQNPGQMTLPGFFFTLAASFMWACSNMVARRAARISPSYDPLAFVVWSSAIPILPFVALASLDGGAHAVVEQLRSLNLKGFAAVAYLAFMATLLAYALWTRLLMRHQVNRVAPFSLLVPVIGIAAATAFGEIPGIWQLTGSALVLSGLGLNVFGPRLWQRWQQWQCA